MVWSGEEMAEQKNRKRSADGALGFRETSDEREESFSVARAFTPGVGFDPPRHG